MRFALLIAPAAALLMAAPGTAQTGTDLLSQLGGKAAGGGLLGGLGGGLGGGLAGAGANNITGLLGYCLKNQLLGSASGTTPNAGGAGSLLGKLTGKQGVTQSQGFLAGQQGVVQAGGTNLPLGSLGDGVKQQVCRSVLSRAGGLLRR